MSEEIWKPIKGYDGLYEVSNMGRVRSLDRKSLVKNSEKKIARNIKGKVLKSVDNGHGYKLVNLAKNSKTKKFYIHRLVAETFLPNSETKLQVDHMDFNKANNKVSNLRWVSAIENIRHNIENDRFYYVGHKNKGRISSKGKIVQFDLNMNKLNIFSNSTSASRETGVCARNILHCVNHKEGRTQAGGYKWLYESEVVSNALRDIENG